MGNEEGLEQMYELWDEDPDFSRNRALLARAREHGASLKEAMTSDGCSCTIERSAAGRRRRRTITTSW